MNVWLAGQEAMEQQKDNARQEEVPLGPRAFALLRAEDEPWLPACFVPPPDFERIASPQQSVAVLAGPGGGKTAIIRALEAQSIDPTGRPSRLLVRWRPSIPFSRTETGLPLATQFAGEILDACVEALVRHLANRPQDYADLPPWAWDRLAWFVQRLSLGDPVLRWGPMTEGKYPGSSLVRRLLSSSVRDVLYPGAPFEHKVAQLGGVIEPIGLQGIWILSDNLGEWAALAPQQVVQSIEALLSTSFFFEEERLAFKLCFPLDLEPSIRRTKAVRSHRITLIPIQWETSHLRNIVERRLAFAFGRTTFPLRELCDAPGLLEWMEKVGGTSPREWLDQTAILAEYYAAHPESTPVDEATWKRLRAQRPPRLHIDEKQRCIIVGGREVKASDIPPSLYGLLRYLYQRANEIVSRQEAYFKGYRGLDHIPDRSDPEYETPSEFGPTLHTAIWRLRHLIEPDPKHPVLLITHPRHGLQLRVR